MLGPFCTYLRTKLRIVGFSLEFVMNDQFLTLALKVKTHKNVSSSQIIVAT